MQAPGSLDLVMYQGASWDYTLTWNVSGSPVNLTGYTARMQVRPSVSASTTVLSLTDTDGISLGGSAGTIGLSRAASATALVAANTYVYDLELVSGANVVTRLVEGKFTVSPEVTR